MRGRPILACVLLAAAACSRGGEGGDAGELVQLATKADTLTYRASYRYTLSGQLQRALRTTMHVAQRPPRSLRRIEVSTEGTDGKRVNVTEWLFDSGDRHYACTPYPAGEIACLRTGPHAGMFGSHQVDEIFSIAREADSFSSVKEGAAIELAGERARCFDARPKPSTPPPVRSPQPRFTPTRFAIEICYTGDGIMTRARRRILDPVPSGVGGRESLFEAISVSRKVAASELKLPGPVRGPDDLPLSPTPTSSPTPRRSATPRATATAAPRATPR